MSLKYEPALEPLHISEVCFCLGQVVSGIVQEACCYPLMAELRKHGIQTKQVTSPFTSPESGPSHGRIETISLTVNSP